MMIVKVGGSLLSNAAFVEYLKLLSEQGKKSVVIVPGGGGFADQVRSTQKIWGYDDTIAHYMAILAMQQMALLFKGLCSDLVLIDTVESIASVLQQQQVVVWSPRASQLDAGGVPASWDVTSDTLAAWLAVQLSAQRLLLLKSAALPMEPTLEALSALGIVDKAFVQFVQDQALAVECIQCHHLSALAACLNNDV